MNVKVEKLALESSIGVIDGPAQVIDGKLAVRYDSIEIDTNSKDGFLKFHFKGKLVAMMKADRFTLWGGSVNVTEVNGWLPFELVD